MSAHSHGPWEYVQVNDDVHFASIVCKRDPIGTKARDIAAVWLRGGHDKSEANARLIAAAPDLLEALIECAERLQIHMRHTEDLMAHMKAHKAIAKATGEAE